VRERKAYKARNPKTGEAVIAPARRRILFRPGQELKAALKNIPEGGINNA
jgi:nucleoid DNA-binding protein